MRIRFTKDHKVGWDGLNAVLMAKGDEKETTEELGQRLIDMGVARNIEKTVRRSRQSTSGIDQSDS
jgi:hypothetical protein